tara:strand:- start:1234 stop:2676 length:1443 start_codon:yes stop_codon:yes gene_type:complete
MKDLVKIMEQVLMERFPYDSAKDMWGLENEPQPNSSENQLFKKVADQQPPKDEVTELDFDFLLANPQEIDEKTQSKLIALVRSPNAPDDVKAKSQEVLDNLETEIGDKVTQRQTITQPQIRSAAGQVGDFPDEMNTIIDSVLGTNTDLLERIRKTSEISQFYYEIARNPEGNSQALANKPDTEFLAEVMLLEYFAEIANSFDVGAGSYLFEYYLAALAGGRVTGKEAGPASGMGAVDFTTQDGRAGSSKFYSQKSNISQAISGFEIGQEVQYIIALKKQTTGQIGKVSAAGGSDAARIIAADIYYLSVTKTDDASFDVRKVVRSGDVGRTNLFRRRNLTKDGRLRLGDFINEGTFLSTMFVAETRTKTFRDMIYKSVSSNINNVKRQILTNLQSFFQELEVAQASCRTFASSGELDEGTNTLTALDAADKSFEEFANKLVGATIKKDSSERELEITENKNNFAKILDKAMQEVILEIMKK